MSAYQQLINDLESDSKGFVDRGLGYALLQEFFHGEPVESLRRLLHSSDMFVQRVASFVASELGVVARPLLPDVCLLLRSEDLHARFNALEAIAVCAIDDDVSYYAQIVSALESPDKAICQLAMYLMSRAQISQLSGARDAMRSNFSLSAQHEFGLNMLINEMTDVQLIGRHLHDEEAILRCYAAVAARRGASRWPELMDVMKTSSDPVLSEFAAQS